ncbi:DUF805 domain-containing protein [Sphingorhabdus arenilitoris]|uniref:DUF805 domain-containing protein n=1 Tax=Sphingorhabdus arenilitoris TaxID=1490041 RepID=A0ABV8RJD8_9SPHN
MMKSIFKGYLNIFNFRGRTPRREFFPFFIANIFLYFGASQIVIVQMLMQMIANGSELQKNEHYQAALEQSTIELTIFMYQATAVIAAGIGISLGAAVFRRVHDSGGKTLIVKIFALVFISEILMLWFAGPQMAEAAITERTKIYMVLMQTLNAVLLVTGFAIFIAILKPSELDHNEYGPNDDPNRFENLREDIASIKIPARSYAIPKGFGTKQED